MRRVFAHPFVRTHASQGWKFLATGLLGAISDLGSLTILVEVFDPPLPIAFALSTLLAVSVVFHVNRRWTFANRQGHLLHQYGKFLIVYGVGFVLNVAVSTVLAVHLGFWYIFAKAVAIGMVMFWNYTLLHSFVFAHRPSPRVAADLDLS